jgi:hypothetical protein
VRLQRQFGKQYYIRKPNLMMDAAIIIIIIIIIICGKQERGELRQ